MARRSLTIRRTVTTPIDLIAHPDVLALELQATSGVEAIRALHARLGAVGGGVTDAPRFLADLVERAAMASVCIAADIAVPHARTGAVGRMVLAVGRSTQDVAFDPEHPGVRLVFLIGTPRAAVADYLKLVAGLARLLKKPGVRAGLLAAKTEAEFLARLARGAESKR